MLRVVIVLSLLSVCACAETPIERSSTAERGSPDTGDWRSAATILGKRLALQLRDQDDIALAVAPRAAPDYFTDLLLQELFRQGIAIAERPAPDKQPDKQHVATLVCRSAQFDANARYDASSGDFALVCSVTWHGRYIAAANYVVKPDSPPSHGGVVIKVTQ